MIYLDNAATTFPKPENVYTAMDKFLREKGGNPGRGSHSLALAAGAVIEETRWLTAQFLHTSEVERVIFTLNCTDSLNLALKGILKPGDHVIVSSLEHNAVMRPLTKLEKQGVNISRVPVSPGRGFTLPVDIEKAILPQTRMIVTVHASNVNGIIQPIEEYGAIARKHNLLFLVDAAQSTGHLDLNVEDSKIDLLAFSGHKGTFGPPGVGVLYIGARANPDTIREGGTGSFSEYETQPEQFPDRFESGTLNSVGICGLGAGLKFIQDTGLDKIIAHEKKLVDVLISGLSGIPGLILYFAPDREKQAPVISFNIQGYDPGEVATILDQAFDIKVRSGLHCAPAAHKTLGTYPKGTVRISPGYFNTETEIEQVIQAINKIARSRN